MKRYTAGSVGDMCKILGTGRHMKQYALAEKTHNTGTFYKDRKAYKGHIKNRKCCNPEVC